MLSKEELAKAGRLLRATKMLTATPFRIARCPAPIIRAQPGLRVAAVTTRKAQYSERSDDYANNMDRLARKFETARTLVPRPELVRNDGNEIGIIAYGTSHHALVETLDQLQNEYGVNADYLRLRAYPFTRETHDFIAAHKRIYIVDQNRDGQMHELLKLDVGCPRDRQTAQRPPLQRAADRRALHHRRNHFPGGQVMATTTTPPPQPKDESRRTHRPRLSRRQDHALRRMRPQCDFRAHHRRLLRDGYRARARSQDVGHRLLLEDARRIS